MVSKYFNLMVAAGTSEGSANNYGVLPYIFAFLSSIIWPLAWIYSNEQSVNMAETTMIRGITNLVANYVICKMSDSDITFKNGSTFKYILIRSLILSTTSLFVGVSQFILPLSIVHTIISSATLFVFIIDYAINSVMVNLKQAVGIAIGMIGMVLASNGRFISTLIDPDYEEHSRFQNYITDNIYITVLFTFAFIVVIIFTSYAFVLTKHLKCNPFQINYFLGFTSLFSGALLLQFIPNSYQPRSIITQYDPIVFYKAIIFTGIPLLFDQWFLMAALTMTKESGIVSMISCTSIIIGYLVSVFRYGERPNLFINVGIGLLVLGMYQTLFNINKQQQDEEVESVSGQDNEDGTFKSGIHRNLHKGPIGEPSASTNNAGQQQSASKNLAVNSKEKNKDDQDRLILRHEVSLSD